MSLESLYSTDFVALEDTDSVGHGIEQMLRHDVTDLPVIDAAGKLTGVFRLACVFASLLPKAALIGYGMSDLGFVATTLEDMREHMHEVEHHPIADYQVQSPHTVTPETSPVELVLLLYKGAGSVPVVAADGKLLGMVSARELLGALHRVD